MVNPTKYRNPRRPMLHSSKARDYRKERALAPSLYTRNQFLNTRSNWPGRNEDILKRHLSPSLRLSSYLTKKQWPPRNWNFPLESPLKKAEVRCQPKWELLPRTRLHMFLITCQNSLQERQEPRKCWVCGGQDHISTAFP